MRALVVPHVPKRALRVGAAALGILLAATLLACRAHAAGIRDAPLQRLAATGAHVLRNYMTRASPRDPRFYANGNWYALDGPPCWYCYDAAAVGAATLSQQPGGDPAFRRIAIHTLNTAIAEHQQPNGAFPYTGTAPDGVGTGFFTVDLGVTYLELYRTLPSRIRRTWRRAIARAADYLITSGDATWYINGNVNLRQTEVFWLAWAITHQKRFYRAYNAEWAFTISPDQRRWGGYGLQLTVRPRHKDGSDGSGYLAESGGGTPGYDPSYTDAQLDSATDLYVLTRAPRYLRLMNLLFNQLRPRINPDWILNATHGTRANYVMPFMDPAVSVLAASGHRRDLAPQVRAQLALVEAEYVSAQSFTNVNFYKGFEAWISMPLLNHQWPRGMCVPGCAQGRRG